ncbi:MAG: hypothetical protein IPM63_05810 [Acidobacteriota bacterium]|nr:MAG: hypothetical protein IPM63_05810 [Acidobacteriota bacterium]
MRTTKLFFAVIGLFAIGVSAASAQNGLPDIGIQGNLALGVVKVKGPEKIVVETKDGVIDSILVSTTKFKKLPPDNLSLKAATDSSLEELSVGDRVLLTGQVSADKKSIVTTGVYLVKASDLAAQQAKQRAEWQSRGISGRVTAVDQAAGTITVEMRGITGAATILTVSAKEGAKFLRYSPESPRYSDALSSNLGEIEAGDMIQALGDRNAEANTFAAEEIITGAFQTVAGTVKSVDADKNEVTITDLVNEEDLVIAVNASSLLKKFPEEAAQRLAGFQAMMGSGGQGRPGGGQARPAGEGQGRPGGRMDLNEMLNRFPTITVSDLKPGDMIAVSSPKGKDPGRLTAIKLLAGVEPFIRMAQMAAGAQRGRGVSGSLNIPGLDSVEF